VKPATEPTALVRGCGPTGALAALALADAGWRVTVVDPAQPQQLLQRQRAYAFTHSSRLLLQTLGLWERLQPELVPFETLQLADLGSGTAVVPFSAADLRARNRQANTSAVGWIGLHRPLLSTLLTALERHPAVDLQLGVATPTGISADLVVAADGPHSPSRESLGIGKWQWGYQQSCLTAQVQLRGTAAQQACELFRPEGPLALLPLGGNRCQLVWSAHPDRCRRLEQLSPDAFLDQLAGTLPAAFQPEALEVAPQSFPVGLALARRLHRGQTVLVGESAHRSHPVGGQGLNLCWRDVATLHRLACRVRGGQLAAADLPSHYSVRRWPDLVLTLASTDLLVRLFSNRRAPLLLLRRLALLALARVPALRRLSLAAMTEGPCRLLRL
jgi:2-octaprenyl-6-methoxyphenol hydroxylase